MNRNKLMSECTVSEFKEIVCDLIDYYVQKTSTEIQVAKAATVDCTGRVHYHNTPTPDKTNNTITCNHPSVNKSSITKMSSFVVDNFDLSEGVEGRIIQTSASTRRSDSV